MSDIVEYNREYYDKLFSFSKEFVKKQMKPFTSDDLRFEFLKSNPEANNLNSLGAIFRILQKEGLIKFNNTYTISKKQNKGRVIKQWISKEYSESQSKKRILEETIQSRELAKKQINLDLK